MSACIEIEYPDAVLPETLLEWVEYDLVADFRETMTNFPDSDWEPAYRYYRWLVFQGTPMHEEWEVVFRRLRKTGCV